MDLKETKSTVVTTIISSEDGRNTYEIRKEIMEENSKEAVVIMLYPGTSYRDILKCDSTSQAIINHCEELGISRLRMVNLFSKVCSSRMSTRNIEIDTDNIAYIEGIMKEENAKSYDWIIAWGSSMPASVVAKQSKFQILLKLQKHLPSVKPKQFTVDNMDIQNEKGVHPLYMGIYYKNQVWKLQDYVLPKEILDSSKKKKESKSGQKEDKTVKLVDKIKKNANSRYIMQDKS